MIAKVNLPQYPGPFLLEFNLESTNMDWLQTHYYFSGQKSGSVICDKQWLGKIEKCYKGNKDNEVGLRACCRNQGVPYECSGYCTPKEAAYMWAWKCEEWSQESEECRKGNDGYVCCEEQGVPKECSFLCETS